MGRDFLLPFLSRKKGESNKKLSNEHIPETLHERVLSNLKTQTPLHATLTRKQTFVLKQKAKFLVNQPTFSYLYPKANSSIQRMKKQMLLSSLLIFLISACDIEPLDENDKGYIHYVSPSIDSRGRFRKGHFRKSFSTHKNAFKNRARSRYYYHTRGKYRRRKTKN